MARPSNVFFKGLYQLWLVPDDYKEVRNQPTTKGAIVDALVASDKDADVIDELAKRSEEE